jgi:hypothetical protein
MKEHDPRHIMETMVNAPNLIPEFGQLLLVFWIKSEFRLGVDNDPRVESSTAEHHCRFDVGIPVKDTLWTTMLASKQKPRRDLTT